MSFYRRPSSHVVDRVLIGPDYDPAGSARVRRAIDSANFPFWLSFRSGADDFIPKIKSHSRCKNLDYSQRVVLPSGLRIVCGAPDAVGRWWWSCLWGLTDMRGTWPVFRDLVSIFEERFYDRFFFDLDTGSLKHSERARFKTDLRDRFHSVAVGRLLDEGFGRYCVEVDTSADYFSALRAVILDLPNDRFILRHLHTVSGVNLDYQLPTLARDQTAFLLYRGRSRYAPRALTLFGSCYNNPKYSHLLVY